VGWHAWMDKFQSGSLSSFLSSSVSVSCVLLQRRTTHHHHHHYYYFFFFFFVFSLNIFSCTHFYFFFLSTFSFSRLSQSRCLDILSESCATTIFIDVVVCCCWGGGGSIRFSPPSCPHSVADITHTHTGTQQLVVFFSS
jgi:hypothetical protein